MPFVVGCLTLIGLALPAGVARAQDHTPTPESHKAQHEHASPYAGDTDRKIKALSDQEIRNYLAGEGMGLARVAELNHYPGPRHVLDLASELGLSDDQVAATQRIFAEMRSDAQRLGRAIVEREHDLDAQFREGVPDEAEVRAVMEEIGRLNAELRFVHVRAHLQMKEVLSEDQISSYDRLRGYTAPNAD